MEDPLEPISGAVTTMVIEGTNYIVAHFSEYIERLVLTPHEARVMAMELQRAALDLEGVVPSIGEEVTLDLRTPKRRDVQEETPRIDDPVRVFDVPDGVVYKESLAPQGLEEAQPMQELETRQIEKEEILRLLRKK
jgi:hypothetical protein